MLSMPSGYDQGCPVAKALDVVGEKWALLVLRICSARVLYGFMIWRRGSRASRRTRCRRDLKTLEKQGVIGARLYEQHPPRFEYFLTDKGKALGPVLKALYNWGELYG